MEMFQLVDRAGRPIGQAAREACHGNPRLIHLVIHLHVLDPARRLYLQKRGQGKDTNPGLWDTSVGGHVRAGEPLPAALAREAEEELGIDASGARFLYGYRYESAFESEYAQCFALAWAGAIHANPDEIEEGRFFTSREVEAILGTGALTPMFEREWPMLAAALYPERPGAGPFGAGPAGSR